MTIGTGWLGSGNWWNGRLGEIRISNISRSTAWISASYYAESDTLMSYAAPQSGGSTTSPVPPSVTTSAANSITTGGATLNGNLGSLGTASSVAVSFQYGLTTSYGSTTASQTKSATGAFSTTLNSLAAGTAYHYRAVATGDGTGYGSDQVCTTATSSPPPPSASSTFGLSSGDSVYTSTFLNAQSFPNTVGGGTLTRLEVLLSDTTASGNLRLGVYADNGGVPGGLLLDAGSVAATNGWVGIAGLNLPVAAGANYWLAYLPQNPVGVVYQSAGMPANSHDNYAYSFGPLPGTASVGEMNGTPFVMRATVAISTSTPAPPSVITNAATGITTAGAALNGNLTSLGTAASVAASFQYGLTTSYGSSTASQTRTSTGAFSTIVSSLNAGTTYHYRAVAFGDSSSYGPDQTFTTANPTVPPSVTTNAAGDIGRHSVVLNGSLDGLGSAGIVSVYFQYGTTSGYGNSTPALTMTSAGVFSAGLTGLASGAAYHYRAVAVGVGGVTVYGGDRTFSTYTKGRP